MISYIQAIDVIRAFALQHVFVSKFNYEFKEQMPNLGTLDEAYPFLYVVPTGANVTEFTNEFDLDIYCVDRLQKDRTNTNFILNDCQQVLADLSLWLEQGQDDIEVIQSYPMTPINNDLLDYVAGWVMRVRIQVTRIGLCEIPFGGESPTPPTCPSGFVRNSDGSYEELVPSGGELILPDTPVLVVDQNQNELANENVISVTGGTIEVFIEPCEIDVYINRILVAEDATEDVLLGLFDQDGNALTFTQDENELTVNIPECEDATVENSDQSYTDTVASGGTLVLPDITVTDSDGTTYTQPAVTDVFCTIPDPCEDATFNINGIEVGTAPSGGTLDLNLIDQNSDEVPFVQSGSDLVVNVPTPSTNSAKVMKTGQTTSYRTGDDGDLEEGRAVDFFTLDFNNHFGNNKRFTGVTGGYYDRATSQYKDVNGTVTTYAGAFPNQLSIDWSTFEASTGNVLMWYLGYDFVRTWNDGLDEITAMTFLTYNDWRGANFNEMMSMTYHENTFFYNHEGFNFLNFSVNIWTSTSVNGSTATTINNTRTVGEINKLSNGVIWFPVRTTNISGL